MLRSICLIALVGGIAVLLTLRADATPPKRSSISLVALTSDEPPKSTTRYANGAVPALPVPPQDYNPPPASEPAKLEQPDTLPQLFPDHDAPLSFDERSSRVPLLRAVPADSNEPAESDAEPSQCPPAESEFDRHRFFGLRHSSTDGRNAGMGHPLVGTSWLNRPYYFGVDIGTVWVETPPQENVNRDADTFGGIYAGYDWDYYWGTELAVQRATPEMRNELQPYINSGDRLMLWTANMMYYPWGDSYYRPYWRLGIGEMDIDYVLDNGRRHDEQLWAIPIGIGIKYPVRRWLAARAEFSDKIGLGNTGVATQHDFTLTFALEWRFGAHPRSYWPWNPSNHIW